MRDPQFEKSTTPDRLNHERAAIPEIELCVWVLACTRTMIVEINNKLLITIICNYPPDNVEYQVCGDKRYYYLQVGITSYRKHYQISPEYCP